jgi:hypothetical protein
MNNYGNVELINGQIAEYSYNHYDNIPLKWSTFEDGLSSGCRVIESDMFENISIWEYV